MTANGDRMQPILVVEDNPTEQFVIKHLLPKFGYSVVIAGTAEDALRVFETEEFSAVLMDLTLPGFSGFVCSKQMRQMEATSERHTPIIALTARTEQSARDQASEAGMDAYVLKPFSKEELRQVLAQYIYKEPVIHYEPIVQAIATQLSMEDSAGFLGEFTPPK